MYLAEHLGLRKSVAVKLLRGELSRDPTFARRFEQEAIAASQIGHEHIVNVTDLGRTPTGELFYVMELLLGGVMIGTTPMTLERPAVDAGPLRLTLEGHVPEVFEHLPEGERLEVTLKKPPPPRVRPDKPRPTKVQDKVQDLKPNPF